MKLSKFILIGLLVAILISACSSTNPKVKYSMGEPTSTGCSTPEGGGLGACSVNGSADPTIVPTQSSESTPDLTRSDSQGAVEFDVTPLNLDNPGDTLIFDVSMNTHSVDLSMELSQLAVLSTDDGKTLQAIQWDAPKGGHHVEGKLSFPTTLDGKNILTGANEITLTITNVDAPSRIFTWQLAK
jgi:hypothetical protein